MSTPAHTPGPWTIATHGREPNQVKVGTGPNGWLGLATVFGDTDDEALANAKLIIKAPLAPKLAEALRRLSNWCFDGYSGDPDEKRLLDAARAALDEWEAQ